ncbi:hypothetical protein P879_03075 [Paragonimus westermani]|uniref:ARID domain-containing protein n=1 Tax=Paragonimus westermani TaxID=34504 RepID=A0A8T0DLY0_9TREM|nr:hypothetical protein P879_03075 [Paragonimus westermani]
MSAMSSDSACAAISAPLDISVADDKVISNKTGTIVFLTPGTAVSAKYRGAYCEATVDQMDLKFRLRVQLKGNKNVVSVDSNALVSGDPKAGCEVTVRVPPSQASCDSRTQTAVERSGIVLRVFDTSLYTVVFDDGDKRTLRRTQLVIKGERHFKESESLDCLPLTNPEQFRQPVINRGKLRSGDDDSNEAEAEEPSFEDLDDEEAKPPSVHGRSLPILDEADQNDKQPSEISSGEQIQADVTQNLVTDLCAPTLDSYVPMANASPLPVQESERTTAHSSTGDLLKDEPIPLSAPYCRLLGRLVLVNMPISNKDSFLSSSTLNDSGSTANNSLSALDRAARRRFTPGLVVLPSAMPSIDLRPVSGATGKSTKPPILLVRSFKDNRFMATPINYMRRLKRPAAVELAHTHPSLRTAFERALLWLDRYELPAPWGENAIQMLLGTKDWRTMRRHYRALAAESSRSDKTRSTKTKKKRKNRLPSPESSASISEDGEGVTSTPAPLRTKRARITSQQKAMLVKKSVTTKIPVGNVRKRARPSDTSSALARKFQSKRPKLKRHVTRKSDISDRSSGSVKPKPPIVSGQQKAVSKRTKEPKSSDSDNLTDDPSCVHSHGNLPSPVISSSVTTSEPSSSDSESVSSSSSAPSSSSSSLSASSSSSSSVDFEARDRWIAQLYRFMDEGGAPINKAPSLANKDLDLYKLYKLVRQLGGFHRVTTQMKWGYIYSKLRLPHHFAAGPRNLQAAFKRYLYPLDDINRKLGTDLDALPLSRPRHSTSSHITHLSCTARSAVFNARSAAAAVPLPKQLATTTDSKSTDKTASLKPVLTVKDGVSLHANLDTSQERVSDQVIESSPPVLSPPILGRTPSPCEADWPCSPIDTTPVRVARRQTTPTTVVLTTGGVQTHLSSVAKDTPSKGDDAIVIQTGRKAKERLPVSTPDKSAKSVPEESIDKLPTMQEDAISCGSASTADSATHGSPTKSERKKGPSSSLSQRQPLFLQSPNSLITANDELDRTKLNRVIPIGSRVRVRCGDRVAYEARVLKHIRPQPGLVGVPRGAEEQSSVWSSATELSYRVHYMGWNTRHDEVVSRSRIISIIEWARPSDSDRPPSCSSLNLLVQEPNKRQTEQNTRDSRAVSHLTRERRRLRDSHASDLKPRSREAGQTIDEENEEEEEEDDDEEIVESGESQTTETASDIVTTTAPMVRRRRLMFDKDDLVHKRSRNKGKTISGVASSEKCKDNHSLVNDESGKIMMVIINRDVHSPEHLTEQRAVTTDPKQLNSRSPALSVDNVNSAVLTTSSSKRPRPGSASVGTDQDSTETKPTVRSDARPVKLKLKDTKTVVPNTTATTTASCLSSTSAVKPEESSNEVDVPKRSEGKLKSIEKGKSIISKMSEKQAQKVKSSIGQKRPLSHPPKKLGPFKDRQLSKRTPLKRYSQGPSRSAGKTQTSDRSRSRSSTSSDDEVCGDSKGNEPDQEKTTKKQPNADTKKRSIDCSRRPTAATADRASAPPSSTSKKQADSLKMHDLQEVTSTKPTAAEASVIRPPSNEPVPERQAATDGKTKSDGTLSKQGKANGNECESTFTKTLKESSAVDSKLSTSMKVSKIEQRSVSLKRKPNRESEQAYMCKSVRKSIAPKDNSSKSDKQKVVSVESTKIISTVSTKVTAKPSRVQPALIESSTDNSEDTDNERERPSGSITSRACHTRRSQRRTNPRTGSPVSTNKKRSSITGTTSRPARSVHASDASSIDEQGSGKSRSKHTDSSSCDSSESDFGAMVDALPRLTRSQHRQLLGDTPPGAALQTASPVAVTAAANNSPNAATPVTKIEAKVTTTTTTASYKPCSKASSKPDESENMKPSSADDTTVQPAPCASMQESQPDTSETTSSIVPPILSPSSNVLEKCIDQEISPEKVKVEDQDEPDSRSEHLLKLRPRSGSVKTEVMHAALPNHTIPEPVKAELDEKDDDDGRSSVQTMSTDPMKDLLFDLIMSPSEDRSTTLSSVSSESLADGHLKMSKVSTRSRKPVADTSDEESSPSGLDGHTHGENHKEVGLEKTCIDEVETADDGVNVTVKDGGPSRTRGRSERVRHVSTSSATADVRRTGKRAPSTPHRSLAFDRSPTPTSDSPHYAPSPVPVTSATGTTAQPSLSSVAAPKLSHPTAPTTIPPVRLGPAQRRFGGPFFPIVGFEEMTSELKCQQLQDRMHRILEAWRAAKQYLKDLDHRTNRSRRSRVRHSTSDQSGLQQPPPTVQSSTPMRSQQLTDDPMSSSAAPQLLDSTPERPVSVLQSQ